MTDQHDLPWDMRPVTARDIVIVAAFTVVACLAGAALLYGPLRARFGPPAPAAEEAANAAPVEVALEEDAAQAAPTSQPAVDQGADAQLGEAIFIESCAACHSIGGGRLVGPDLEGVVALRDYDWLFKWIKEPDVLLAAGDPLAVQMLEEYNNLPMPNMGLSDDDVTAVMAFLEGPQETAAEEPGTEPPAETVVALPEGDAAIGRALFTGEAALANGGPACIGCHGMSGIGNAS